MSPVDGGRMVARSAVVTISTNGPSRDLRCGACHWRASTHDLGIARRMAHAHVAWCEGPDTEPERAVVSR
jgi:hypothetical protein